MPVIQPRNLVMKIPEVTDNVVVRLSKVVHLNSTAIVELLSRMY